MQLSTLFKFLIGDRQAILTIAATPRAIWIGLLLVLTGGLARNYDKEPLLHQPQHVFGPLIVSALIGTGLFVILYGPVSIRGLRGPGSLRAYLIFMTLYWMTAPMAWLYGIPTERMTDIVTATELNLWTLALVSVWRVLLIARVASVIFGAPMWIMLILTCAFSNVIVTGVLVVTPFPVINIMGGIELTQSEQLISEIATTIFALSFITIPALVLGSLVVLALAKGSWQVPAVSRDEAKPRVARGVIALTLAALVLWSAPLPWTQPAQSLRYKTERALVSGNPAEGVAMMASHGRAAYPLHWDPPPRRLYGESEPDALEVLQLALEHSGDEAGWIAEIYAEKLAARMRWWVFMETDFLPFAEVMLAVDAGPRLMYEHRRWLQEESLRDESDEARMALRELRSSARRYAEENDLSW